MPNREPDIEQVRNTIYEYYRKNRREMPWRFSENPYYIVVSELMLQQTQVPRVMQKFPAFIQRFPTFSALAAAPMADVLTEWQGMGYNRRAKFLKQIAEKVMSAYNGVLPDDPLELVKLPGVGKATAGSIAAFAYNVPTVFIETNIRRVFIHFFFNDAAEVHDNDLFPLVERALDRDNPREWYYALMDYGTMMMKHMENPNKKSKHYAVQSRFEGSDRQIRGRVLKALVEMGAVNGDTLITMIGDDRERVDGILQRMEKEGMIARDGERYTLPR